MKAVLQLIRVLFQSFTCVNVIFKSLFLYVNSVYYFRITGFALTPEDVPYHTVAQDIIQSFQTGVHVLQVPTERFTTQVLSEFFPL